MELEQQVSENTDVLKRIVPLVDNHEKVLYGDKDNRKDEGVIGMMNNIEEFVTNAKGWIKWAAMTFIGMCVSITVYVITQLLDGIS